VTAVTFSVNPNFCTVLNSDNITDLRDDLKIYPNPVQDKLQIEAALMPEEIEVYDVTGKLIRRCNKIKTINVTDLSEGVYFLRIKTSEGEFNKKFIRN
jgi:hypothetical protein